MERKRIGWWFSLIGLLALLTFYFLRDNKEIYSIHGETMGTTYNIKVIKKPSSVLKNQIDSLLVEFNLALSTYDPKSEISRFNFSDSLQVKSPYLLKMVEGSREIWKQTQGAFDPTVMPLVNLWGFGFENRSKVDSTIVDSLMTFIGYEKVIVSETGIAKKPKGVMLDFSAIAKGFGVDVISNFLKENGYENHMVEIGGEVRCEGQTHNGKIWKIGIEDPTIKSSGSPEPFFVVGLENSSIATSGNYRNFYVVDGVTISHTINPQTGFPERNDLLSVSVISQDCYFSDAMATALMVMGLEKAKEFCKRNSISAALVYDDQGTEVEYTDQFKSYMNPD